MIASCSDTEEKFQECTKRRNRPRNQRGDMRVRLRTKTKQAAANQKARKKCGVKFAFARRNRVPQKHNISVGVRKLLRMMELVLASVQSKPLVLRWQRR